LHIEIRKIMLMVSQITFLDT